MAGFRRLEDIDAWKLSAELRDRILEWTRTGRVSHDFKLRDQIRNSSRSAPGNIAEGFVFARVTSLVSFASPVPLETLNHLDDARTQGYVDEAPYWHCSRL